MSQKIKTSVEIDGSLKASQIENATVDTDKFLVSDGGTVKYRTGAEMLSDLGVVSGTANHVQHQVKAGVAISKGQAVYVTSADGTNMVVGLASNNSEATSSKTMGLLNATVSANGFADVITEGLLSGLNTSAAVVGNPVWLGVNGNLIYGLANKPYAPNHLVFIGIVTRVNANNGEIFVKVQNGFELDELHDIDLKTTAPVGNDILVFEGAPSYLWKNKSISTVLGYTPANANGTNNYIPKFTGATELGNSLIYDNGTNLGIGTTSGISGKLTISSSGGDHVKLDRIGQTSRGIVISGSDNLSLGTWADPTQVSITSVGKVGIGITSPATKLHVYSTENANWTTTFVNGSANGHTVYTGYNNGPDQYGIYIAGGSANSSSYDLLISGNKLAVVGTGNVGVGTSTPVTKLDVQLASNKHILFSNANGQPEILASTDAGAAYTPLYLSGSIVSLNPNNGGSVLIGTTTDAGFKLDVNGTGRFGASIYINNSNTSLYGLVHQYNGNDFAYTQAAAGSGEYRHYIGPSSGWGGYHTFYTDNAERMRITSGGNVGIGTTSPITKFHVDKTSQTIGGATPNGGLVVTNLAGSNYALELGTDTSLVPWIQSRNAVSASYYGLALNPSGGNVGVGTTSPSEKLDVSGNVRVGTSSSYGNVNFVRNGGSNVGAIGWNSDGEFYLGGHPGYGTGAGNNVRLYAFGDKLQLGNVTAGNVLNIHQSGNTTIGTTTDSGYKLDVNGQINTNTFYRIMSGSTLVGAIGYASSIFGSGGNNWVFYNNQATDNLFYTNGSERMRITSGGNVGIGCNPITKFQVNDGTNINLAIKVGQTDSSAVMLNAYNDIASANIPLEFRASKFNFTNGNVGIGTTAPSTKFQVKGNGNNMISLQYANDGESVGYGFYNAAGSELWSIGGGRFVAQDALEISRQGSLKMIINSSGNVGIGTTSPSFQLQLSNDSAAKPGSPLWTVSSDIRIKENIRPYTDGLEKLMQVNPVYYDYNGKAGFSITKDNVGIIAQEMQEVLPNTIKTFTAKLNEVDENEIELLSFNANELIYVLINSVKELKAEIEILKQNK